MKQETGLMTLFRSAPHRRSNAKSHLLAFFLAMAVLGSLSAHAQTSLQQLPADMRPFVLFGAGVKSINYMESQGMRFLRYDYEAKMPNNSCGDRNSQTAYIWVEDYGSSMFAHQQFDVDRVGKEQIAQFVKTSSQIQGADEAAVFEFKHSPKCFNHMVETVFRVGNWKVMLAENWWYVNSPPPPSGLAARLAALAQGGKLPTPPAVAQQILLLTVDGKTVTINLAEWNGGKLSVQQMALVKQFQLAPPAGSDAAKIGAAGYTLNVYNYPGTGPNVPVFVAPRIDQGAQAAASAAVEGAQAAASWVKANPGKASLAALGLAVSIAMPYTVAFQASAAGMTFFESAGIGFMTAAAPSAVSSLVTSAIAGEGFWNTTGKAVKSGVISGAESLVSTTVGAGVTGMVTGGAALTQKLVGTELSEAAVTGFGAAASGVAGTATDLGVGILHDQVAEQIANSATAANIADLVTPSGPAPTGGLVLPFHSRALTPNYSR